MMSGPDGVTARDAMPDACPGAVRVHQAADGGLARVRVPGGRLRAAQLAVLAQAAADLGDPSLELTSRGNAQIRALVPGAERELASRLHAAGLLPSESHERVRNIIASPLSGRDTAGFLDVRPIVAELDRLVISAGVLSQLPGRFLFTLDDGRGDVTGLTGDVGVQAVAADRLALLLAGVDTGIRVSQPDAAALMVEAATAFLTVRAALSSTAWRLAELPEGVARVTTNLNATGSRRRAGPHGDPGRAHADLTTGAERGSCADVPVRVAGPGARPAIGILPQADGRVALSLVVPLGRLTPAACAALVGVADEIIVTPWRSVIVPDLNAAPVGLPDLVSDAASPWAGVTSCAGLPHCAKAHADVQQQAHAAVHAAVDAAVDGAVDGATRAPRTTPGELPPGPGLPVHWAGCERRCGRPGERHVEVLALADGQFTVSLDDREVSIRHPEQLAAAVSGWRKP